MPASDQSHKTKPQVSQNQHLLYSYLLPVLLSIVLLVTSLLLGIVKLSNVLSASLLFIVIGLAIFFAEIIVGRKVRGLERQETYTFISNLLLRNKVQDAAHVLNLEEVMAIEAAAEEVWIYAFDLAWEGEDSVFPDVVLNNLKRGAKYRYIVPNNKTVHLRVNNLRYKYGVVKKANHLIKFKSRTRDLKLVQFGITIYNPTMLNRNARTDCIAVFFPHYSFYGPMNNKNAPFIAIRGQATIEIQEGFLEFWDESQEIPTIISNDL